MTGDGATFNQTFANVGVVNNAGRDIYQIGDSTINVQGASWSEVAGALTAFRRELEGTEGLDDGVRKEVSAELDAVSAEVGKEQPATDEVVSRLDRIKTRLQSAGGAAGAAVALAATIAKLAGIVAGIV
jgi:hypothetical protein